MASGIGSHPPVGPGFGLDIAVGVEPALAHALADELVAITGLLADLAYDLAANPATLRHHMHSLQGIDRITQAQLAVADLLRSPSSAEEGIGAVTLEEMAARLRQSLDRYRRDGTAAAPSDDDTA